MDARGKKIGRKFLCVLAAVTVTLSLVVLPHAQTGDSTDPSSHDSQYTDSDKPVSNSGGSVAEPVSSDPMPGYEYEDDNIVVKAELSDAPALPEGTKLQVEPITPDKDGSAYKNIEAQVNKSVKTGHQTVTGLQAYDIYFAANGTRYEPQTINATITIQYKKGLFEKKIKESTDEIKVMQLNKTDDMSNLEDVTKAVDVKDVGTRQAVNREAQLASVTDSGSTDTDTVEFVAKSLSTFAVTGIGAETGASIPISLKFMQADGKSIDTSVSGAYYLYIECPNYDSGNAYHYTQRLDVSGGQAAATLNGLYDQNGNGSSGGLYSLNDVNYTAILFMGSEKFSSTYDTQLNKFVWDQNSEANFGIIKIKQGNVIADNYTVTKFPETFPVADGHGTLEIAATAKNGIRYSASNIMSRLSPVLPFGVFADTFHLNNSEVEGCIAANSAEISGDFGNTINNISCYWDSSNTIKVTKTYLGTTQKTFRFGLYYKNSLTDVKTLLLPSGGENTGTVTFKVGSNALSDYTVRELKKNDSIININDTYDGFTLTDTKQGKETDTPDSSWTSYINTFADGSTGGHLLGDNSKLIVGSGSVGTWNSLPCVRLQNGKIIDCNSSSVVMQKVGSKSFPIDFSSVLGKMEALSEDLSQAQSTDTVVVKNYKAVDFQEFKNNTFNFNILDGQMLLLNIDASECSDFSFPENSKLCVNSQSNGGFVSVAPSILINVYSKNGSSCVPYTGAIRGAGFMMGTLLAPRAAIHTSATYNGRLIGKEVFNDSNEIHSIAPGSKGASREDQFTNAELSSPYTLPETGGAGTTIFYYAGGGILLFGAALAFTYALFRKKRQIRKRRRNCRNE